MDKRLRKYYYAATLNLFLWLPLFALLVFPGVAAHHVEDSAARAFVIGGLVLAALLQHWAYYDIYNAKTRLSTSLPNDRNAS